MVEKAQKQNFRDQLQQMSLKDILDRSAIMVCEVKFGAKILPVYGPFNIKVK